MTTGGRNRQRCAASPSIGSEHGVARRDFIKLVGLGTAALGASTAVGLGAAAQALNVVPLEEFPEHGPESRIVSLCGLCPARCGTIVRKIGSDGLKRGERAVKVEGNPLDPINQGALCPVGQAMLQLVYNPDRIRSPMKCVGERGAGGWQAISWQEAIATIKAKLGELRGGPGAHTVAVLSNGTSELAGRLMTRFLDAYGSPNFILDAGAAPSGGQDLT